MLLCVRNALPVSMRHFGSKLRPLVALSHENREICLPYERLNLRNSFQLKMYAVVAFTMSWIDFNHWLMHYEIANCVAILYINILKCLFVNF